MSNQSLTPEETDAVVWYRSVLAGYSMLSLPEKRQVGELLRTGQREIVFQLLIERLFSSITPPGFSEHPVQFNHPALVIG